MGLVDSPASVWTQLESWEIQITSNLFKSGHFVPFPLDGPTPCSILAWCVASSVCVCWLVIFPPYVNALIPKTLKINFRSLYCFRRARNLLSCRVLERLITYCLQSAETKGTNQLPSKRNNLNDSDMKRARSRTWSCSQCVFQIYLK